jgi:hypothetical protein
MNRPCPNCASRELEQVTIAGRERAVCVACFGAWWIEDERLVGATQPLFSDD